MQPMTSPESEDSVVVVGAGIAGLAAGQALRSKGFRVTVIEARKRIGGRIWTDRSLAGIPLELGASWIHGIAQNPVVRFARRSRIATVQTDYDSSPHAFTAKGRLVTPIEIRRLESRFNRLMAETALARERLDRDTSLGAALRRAPSTRNLSRSELRGLMHLVHTHIEQEYGASVSDLSLWYWDEVEEFRGAHVMLPGGFDQIAIKLADGLEVKLGQVAKQIDYDDKGVRVTTDLATFCAGRAVITLPLGVLKRRCVRFAPDLPTHKVAAIKKLRMGLLNKLLLVFDKCFWPPEAEWLECMGREMGVCTEFFNLFKYTGDPVLVGFNVDRGARRSEQLSDRVVVAEAMNALSTICRKRVPGPAGWRITRWASDPFSLGSYSYIPPGASGEDYDAIAEPVDDRLFFAGEATSRGHYGTVRGAFLSGRRAALSISDPAVAEALIVADN
jgi:monoamine oxidase